MINFYTLYTDPTHLELYSVYASVLKKCDPLHFYRAELDIEKSYDYSKITHILRRDPDCAKLYAMHILKERWYEAEPIIATSALHSYEYAKYVVKGRWEEGEKSIMRIPGLVYHYAQDIIKDRWPEAEHIVKRNNMWRREYETTFDVIIYDEFL